MTKYREILRLKSLNFSERNIALSCGVSRNTVSKVLKGTLLYIIISCNLMLILSSILTRFRINSFSTSILY